MRQHQAIDVLLPALGPLAIVLTNNGWAVAQDVRYLLKRGSFFQESGRQCVAKPMTMSVLDARFLEDRSQSLPSDACHRSARRLATPEIVRTVLGSVAW